MNFEKPGLTPEEHAQRKEELIKAYAEDQVNEVEFLGNDRTPIKKFGQAFERDEIKEMAATEKSTEHQVTMVNASQEEEEKDSKIVQFPGNEEKAA